MSMGLGKIKYMMLLILFKNFSLYIVLLKLKVLIIFVSATYLASNHRCPLLPSCFSKSPSRLGPLVCFQVKDIENLEVNQESIEELGSIDFKD